MAYTTIDNSSSNIMTDHLGQCKIYTYLGVSGAGTQTGNRCNW